MLSPNLKYSTKLTDWAWNDKIMHCNILFKRPNMNIGIPVLLNTTNSKDVLIWACPLPVMAGCYENKTHTLLLRKVKLTCDQPEYRDRKKTLLLENQVSLERELF